MSSRSEQVNYKVSAERLHAVQRNMLQLGAPNGKVNHRFAKAVGEDFFAFRQTAAPDNPGLRDGIKSGEKRLVIIGLSPAPIGIPTRRFRVDFVAEVLAFCRAHVQTPGN